MAKQPRVFKYQKGRRIGEVIIVALVFTLAIFIFDAERSGISEIMLVALITGLLIFILSYTYLLNDSFQIDAESLTINKKIGRANRIPFNRICRVTIKEEENALGANRFAITVFEPNKNTRIIASDLDGRLEMVDLIEQKGKEFGFNVIHQDVNGEIVGAL